MRYNIKQKIEMLQNVIKNKYKWNIRMKKCKNIEKIPSVEKKLSYKTNLHKKLWKVLKNLEKSDKKGYNSK